MSGRIGGPPPRWLVPVCGEGGAGVREGGESSIRLPTLAGAKVIHPYASHSVTPRVGEVRGRGVSFLSQVYIIGEVGGG